MYSSIPGESDYQDIQKDNDLKQNEKPSIGQELCTIPLASGLTAAVNSVGAAVLSKAGYVGYNIPQAASLGAIGGGILYALVFVGNRCIAATCGESKPSESRCVQWTKSVAYAVAGTFAGWGILKLRNLTSMGFDQAIYSNLTGSAIAGGAIIVTAACCGLTIFCCKQKSPQPTVSTQQSLLNSIN